MTTERNQPRMPVVEIETWQSDDGVIYADLVAGEGLTKAVLGVRAPHESGLELIIGGSPINTYINQVLTLDDVRALAALGRTDIVDRLQALFKHCQVAQEPAG